MKPFITWKQEKRALKGFAGDTVIFTIVRVSKNKDKPVYDLFADIFNRHISYYRTEDEAKAHAELTVQHFLKRLGFWQCIVERENQGA